MSDQGQVVEYEDDDNDKQVSSNDNQSGSKEEFNREEVHDRKEVTGDSYVEEHSEIRISYRRH